MPKLPQIDIPTDIDWEHWTERWERMQDHYIPRRKERFALMAQLVANTQENISPILDLGCGTGSLMLLILQRFPKAEVFGIDFDPTLLILAKKRLSGFGTRVQLIECDLRDESWVRLMPNSISAALSATALHWLNPRQLNKIYKQLAKILRPGGIFLNADHVRSVCPGIQTGWEEQRDRMRSEQAHKDTDDWEGFWDAYGRALGADIRKFRAKLTEPWQGSEEGLPLEWHFEKLRACGFEALDCFWRLDCDAVYGGIRQRM